MRRIVYIAFGRDDVRTQALYAAMSALAHAKAPVALHLYTDLPEAFARLAGRAEVRLVGPADVERWRGPGGYTMRAKPAVFQELAGLHPADPLLLVDADTYFTGDVDAVFARLGPRTAVMFEREYHVATSETALMYRFRRRLRRARFRGERIDLGTDMWNSGAVGLAPELFHVVPEWLAFLDEVYPATRRWVLEQYALAYVLQCGGHQIAPCDDLLVHYWSDKPAHHAAVCAELERTRDLPLDEALAGLRADPIRLPRRRAFGRKASFFQRVFGW